MIQPKNIVLLLLFNILQLSCFTTAKTHFYTFNVARGHLAPDGVNQRMLLVNGVFPGPTIEINLGDTISVTVINNIADPPEGTAIHWHGIPQRQSKWADGVPSVTQCPIAPGSSFTYTFTPEVAGTTWWHAHYTAQYTDGLFGALIVHGNEPSNYDIDMGPFFITDRYHIDYVSYLLPVYNIPPLFLPVDTNLINGRGSFNCSLDPYGLDCKDNAPLPSYTFQTGKTHLLRIINSGGAALQHFSIDNHEMTVVANDFTPVKPYKTKVVTLGLGQRTDVLVKATGKSTDAVWMRSDVDPICVGGDIRQGTALAAINYPKADQKRLPKTSPHRYDFGNCTNDALETTVPLQSKTPPQPDLTKVVDITAQPNGTGNLVFSVDGSQFRANFSSSLLLAASKNASRIPKNNEYNIHDFGSANHVRLILRNFFPVSHTIHLHGHADFWILAEGMGDWDGRIINPKNPNRRDSAQMRLGSPELPSYLVIQFEADNPGVWSLHCHMVIHSSAGLFMNIVEHADKLAGEDYNDVFKKTCLAWEEFRQKHDPNQFDSGLKTKKFKKSLTILDRAVAKRKI